MLKIGMLTSGGDCQGLNAAIRGVAKSLFEYDPKTKIYGFKSGYRGLIKGRYREMESKDFSGILTLGGTILGTSRMPFKEMHLPVDEKRENSPTRIEAMVNTYYRMELDCLVIMGGNGTHKSANLLREHGCNVVTLPKTIDNDLWGTDVTFGFQSAIDVATDVIDGIHTTAESHGRVFIVEIMGHKVGWLPLYAGMAGGADIILIPEIPYNIKTIKKVIEQRTANNKPFSIIAMAEGAKSIEEAEMSKKDFSKYMDEMTYPSISYKLADELDQMVDQEVRVTVPGHYQRGGQPCPYDRVLATKCGAFAAEMIINKEFGYMAGVSGSKMIKVPLEEVAGKLKMVDPEDELVLAGRQMGIYFGDEKL
ncbi:MAG: 6-phosphofructokinase [Fastidiosipilaceae bacterium]|jgi:6-phosphofructokinase|nr:ATP-dependent 6-phosphofructokinase [Clostridiaceae bacterium]